MWVQKRSQIVPTASKSKWSSNLDYRPAPDLESNGQLSTDVTIGKVFSDFRSKEMARSRSITPLTQSYSIGCGLPVEEEAHPTEDHEEGTRQVYLRRSVFSISISSH